MIEPQNLTPEQAKAVVANGNASSAAITSNTVDTNASQQINTLPLEKGQALAFPSICNPWYNSSSMHWKPGI